MILFLALSVAFVLGFVTGAYGMARWVASQDYITFDTSFDDLGEHKANPDTHHDAR